MTGEEMRGADARAQRLGTPGSWLMEQAGVATAAAIRALMVSAERSTHARLLILCGPGNNGGDGLVAARHLARLGVASEVVLLSGVGRPSTPDALLNWDRLDGVDLVRRVATNRGSDVALYFNGIERACLVVDALLGTGVRGPLREPVRTAVDLAVRAREHLVPVLAVDTPTSLDLTSGEPSDSGRPCRRNHHLPPAQARAAQPSWPGPGRPRPGGTHRHPRRCRPLLG